ncbi:MAG: glucose-6-phosphate dehydrogenase, partial [Pseudoxanthomonas sp.]
MNELAHAAENGRAPPCLLVLFGARGDLARRLVLPALYNLKRAGQLDDNFAILGFDHGDISERTWRRKISDAMHEQATKGGGEFEAEGLDTEAWNWLNKRMHYLRGDFTKAADYRALKTLLAELDTRYETQGN